MPESYPNPKRPENPAFSTTELGFVSSSPSRGGTGSAACHRDAQSASLELTGGRTEGGRGVHAAQVDSAEVGHGALGSDPEPTSWRSSQPGRGWSGSMPPVGSYLYKWWLKQKPTVSEVGETRTNSSRQSPRATGTRILRSRGACQTCLSRRRCCTGAGTRPGGSRRSCRSCRCSSPAACTSRRRWPSRRPWTREDRQVALVAAVEVDRAVGVRAAVRRGALDAVAEALVRVAVDVARAAPTGRRRRTSLGQP